MESINSLLRYTYIRIYIRGETDFKKINRSVLNVFIHVITRFRLVLHGRNDVIIGSVFPRYKPQLPTALPVMTHIVKQSRKHFAMVFRVYVYSVTEKLNRKDLRRKNKKCPPSFTLMKTRFTSIIYYILSHFYS